MARDFVGQAGSDLLWILLGRSENAFQQVCKKVLELGWKEQFFILSTQGASSRSGM